MDEGDFTSLYVSALNFLTTMSMTTTMTAATLSALFGSFQPFFVCKMTPK